MNHNNLWMENLEAEFAKLFISVRSGVPKAPKDRLGSGKDGLGATIFVGGNW